MTTKLKIDGWNTNGVDGLSIKWFKQLGIRTRYTRLKIKKSGKILQ